MTSDKLPPMVIGKYKKPRPFGGKTGAELGFNYHHNAKVWMTAVLYQSWIKKWDAELVAKQRQVLLLQDNFSGHIIPDGLRAIHVENFEPNLTSHVQLDDQGIIQCFKAHYRAKYIERAIDRYDAGTTPSEIYDIDILTAMRLADAAWREVDTTTIRHCWRRAGILPESPPAIPSPAIPVTSLLNQPEDDRDPVHEAEAAVAKALDSLVRTGALQRSNQMDLDSLLNPAIEKVAFNGDTAEEEIFEAMQEATERAQDEEEDEEDEDEPMEVLPTQREALAAAAVLTRFSMAQNSPAARKLEEALRSFTRQVRSEAMRAMVNSSITDYFHCQ
ncbi:hypothetical protein BN946_scf185000.g78 [Trametes cinnabarina]|uniref:DDE-1 domain-containing protein n=1 Tax=Pycnoporus cinnabarinus TaxID=5643 RepID=A0A060S3Q0_PYCCI|nr:hypothetical protein BN946_scf185000.g78 [Trametes cinnabarina]